MNSTIDEQLSEVSKSRWWFVLTSFAVIATAGILQFGSLDIQPLHNFILNIGLLVFWIGVTVLQEIVINRARDQVRKDYIERRFERFLPQYPSRENWEEQ